MQWPSSGISESSRHPSPFCSITVPKRGTSILSLGQYATIAMHVSGARRPRFATSAGLQVVVYPRPDHLRNNWVILFVLHYPGDRLEKASGASTNA